MPKEVFAKLFTLSENWTKAISYDELISKIAADGRFPNLPYDDFCNMCVADLIDEEFWGYGTEHTWLYGIFKRDTYLKNREYAWDTIFYQPSYNEFMSFMRGEDNDIRDIVNEATEIVIPESVRTIYE